MRRRATSVRPLRGQLMFVEVEAGVIKIDCLLGRSYDEAGAPATFQVKLPETSDECYHAGGLLRRWAAEGSAVEITVSAGRRGVVVNMEAASGRVVLEPCDGEGD